MSDKIL